MIRIQESKTYILECIEKEYDEELKLDKGDIIVLVEPYLESSENCRFTILKEKVW